MVLKSFQECLLVYLRCFDRPLWPLTLVADDVLAVVQVDVWVVVFVDVGFRVAAPLVLDSKDFEIPYNAVVHNPPLRALVH